MGKEVRTARLGCSEVPSTNVVFSFLFSFVFCSCHGRKRGVSSRTCHVPEHGEEFIGHDADDEGWRKEAR